jgi:hypothetical protein
MAGMARTRAKTRAGGRTGGRTQGRSSMPNWQWKTFWGPFTPVATAALACRKPSLWLPSVGASSSTSPSDARPSRWGNFQLGPRDAAGNGCSVSCASAVSSPIALTCGRPGRGSPPARWTGARLPSLACWPGRNWSVPRLHKPV